MRRIINPFKRLFSGLPKDFQIPIHALEFNAVRSSGPGGQNVNKVNSKAEIRFKPLEAEWLPSDVRERLIRQQQNRVNKHGELVIHSQEQRSQFQNRDICLAKLKEFIKDAFHEPKERNVWETIGETTKEIRRKEKTQRSKVKSFRGSKSFDE
jgi:protein subunit release factor B